MVPYPFVPFVLLRPSLPAATTTTMPAFHAASTALQSGSLVQLSNTGRPNYRLMTRMLKAHFKRIAVLIAAITLASVPIPF